MLKRDLGDEYRDYDPVAAQAKDRPAEERFAAKEFAEFIQQNGLKKAVFHALRHSSTSLKLKLSGGDVEAVLGDTGHSQSDMVTDVYSHIMDEDRKRLAKKVDTEFFAGYVKPAPIEEPESDATRELVRLLKDSPQLAEHLLQKTQILQKKE